MKEKKQAVTGMLGAEEGRAGRPQLGDRGCLSCCAASGLRAPRKVHRRLSVQRLQARSALPSTQARTLAGKRS